MGLNLTKQAEGVVDLVIVILILEDISTIHYLKKKIFYFCRTTDFPHLFSSLKNTISLNSMILFDLLVFIHISRHLCSTFIAVNTLNNVFLEMCFTN